MLRKIEEQGRVVIPVEYRKALSIYDKDELEVTLKAGEIILKKPIFGCHFCGMAVNLVRIGDRAICRDCIEKLYDRKNDAVF